MSEELKAFREAWCDFWDDGTLRRAMGSEASIEIAWPDPNDRPPFERLTNRADAEAIRELLELATYAWSIIANAPEESWRMLSNDEQREIMVRWRDQFHAALAKYQQEGRK